MTREEIEADVETQIATWRRNKVRAVDVWLDLGHIAEPSHGWETVRSHMIRKVMDDLKPRNTVNPRPKPNPASVILPASFSDDPRAIADTGSARRLMWT